MKPYIGEIRLFSFGYAPKNWLACDGAILQIQTHQALYSLLGITYGGDGRTTFVLPDLRGRTPISYGNNTAIAGGSNYKIGNSGGVETVTLTQATMPPHTHSLMVKNGDGVSPEPNDILAIPVHKGVSLNVYNTSAVGSGVNLNPATISTEGGSAHENMQPYLTLNFCICAVGLFPEKPLII